MPATKRRLSRRSGTSSCLGRSPSSLRDGNRAASTEGASFVAVASVVAVFPINLPHYCSSLQEKTPRTRHVDTRPRLMRKDQRRPALEQGELVDVFLDDSKAPCSKTKVLADPCVFQCLAV